jgi:SWIM zinc finger
MLEKNYLRINFGFRFVKDNLTALIVYFVMMRLLTQRLSIHQLHNKGWHRFSLVYLRIAKSLDGRSRWLFLAYVSPARLVPVWTLTLRAYTRLLLRVQVFGKPLMLAPFATKTPEGEFYFCHAVKYTTKNICCQVIYSLTLYIPSSNIATQTESLNLDTEWRQKKMDARQQRGMELVNNPNIRQKGNLWLVPSQSGKGEYSVNLEAEIPHCTCRDHEFRRAACKHIYAVQIVIERTQTTVIENGKTTVTETVKVEKRVTYKQDWKAYNAASDARAASSLYCRYHLCRRL